MSCGIFTLKAFCRHGCCLLKFLHVDNLRPFSLSKSDCIATSISSFRKRFRRFCHSRSQFYKEPGTCTALARYLRTAMQKKIKLLGHASRMRKVSQKITDKEYGMRTLISDASQSVQASVLMACIRSSTTNAKYLNMRSERIYEPDA
jgi:hypothetical protein